MQPYHEWPGFEHVYLEESWVLDVAALPGALRLGLEVVLLDSHPEHAAPLPGALHCYRRGALTFLAVSELHWAGQAEGPAAVLAEDLALPSETPSDLDARMPLPPVLLPAAHGGVEIEGSDLASGEGYEFRLAGDFGRITVLSPSYPVLTLATPMPLRRKVRRSR